MNKQELIEHFEELPYVSIHQMGKKSFIDLIEQLDEPQKTVVPQFVADWIKYCKRHNFTLFGCLDPVDNFEVLVGEDFEGDARKCILWCRSASDKVARAWLDGYTVEKEKRYLVKIKSTGQCLGKYYINNEMLSPRFIYTGRNADGFTRKELEQSGFGWVFDCPGIEIEEVEG